MISNALYLVGGSIAFGLLTALPVRIFGGGDESIVHCASALAICLLPGVGTLTWAEWTRKRSPEQLPIMVLGGTGVRMFFVLGVGLLLCLTVSYFYQLSFWIWILAAYLFTLTLEMALILGRKSASETEVATINANAAGELKY